MTQSLSLTGTAAVLCSGLSYRFGQHLAVDRVDLDIEQGETFGLLGPNGAGKTTTIRMLTTLLKPATGSARIFGVDTVSKPMRVRRMIGYVPQLLSADASLTGHENVELFARLFDVPRRERREPIVQAIVIIVISALLGVSLTANPIKLLAVAVFVVLGSAFFACLSMSIAGLALSRDRLMGIGQAITMPLFFSSNALYPERLMPGWLQAISKGNPLSYEVDALRGLLLGLPTNLALDFVVLAGATTAAITVASLLLPRLAK